MISIQYELTAAERSFLREQLTVFGMRSRFWLMIFGSLFYGVSFVFFVTRWLEDVAVWLLLPAVLLFGFAAAVAIVSVWRTTRIAVRAELLIDGIGVHQMIGARSSVIAWAAIDAIAEAGDFLIVRPRRMIPIAIPKRSIPDLNELWLTVDAGRVQRANASAEDPKSVGVPSLVYTLSDAEYALGREQAFRRTAFLSNAAVIGVYLAAGGGIYHKHPDLSRGILIAALFTMLFAWLISKWIQSRPARVVDIDIDWIGIGALFDGRPFSAPWAQIRSVTDFGAAIVMRIQKRDAPLVIPKRAIPDISVFRTLVDDRLRDRKYLIRNLQRTLNVRAQRLEGEHREFE